MQRTKQRLKYLTFIVGALFSLELMAQTSPNTNSLRVKWDCQIQEDHLLSIFHQDGPAETSIINHEHLDCDELSDAFFGSLSFFQKVASDETIVLRVRTFPHISGDGIRFIAEAQGVAGQAFEGLSSNGEMHIKSSDDESRIFLKALNVLQRSVLIFAQTIGEISTNQNGQAIITFSAPSDGEVSANPNRQRPWYLDFGFSGNYGLRRMLQINGHPNFVLSKEKWVLRVYAGLSYTRLTFTNEDSETGEESTQNESNIFTFGAIRVSYSFKPNWSIAIMSTMVHAPEGANYRRQNTADVGIEWILRPRRRLEDDVQAGVQYIIGFGQENYHVTTADGLNNRFYARHGLRTFLLWHVNDVLDLQGGVSARMTLNNPRFSNLGINGQASWLVSRSPVVRLNLNIGLDYQPNYLNEPDVNSPGALTVLSGGSNFEPINFNLGFEFLFRLGTNQATERRWEQRP